ncbi:ALQxL family class IV lanthipeptide [Streptomyces sp. NPDC051976]|jgi:hypothetical protein
MELDLDTLQELPAQEEQAVGGCTKSCWPTVCPATCTITDP